jgi:hypothetical protein
VPGAGPEPFDITPWATYLAAFDRYLASGDLEARLTMRVELEDRLDEAGMSLPARSVIIGA